MNSVKGQERGYIRIAGYTRLLSILIITVLLLGSQPIQLVQAATITVDTLVDENDHSCIDGDCSLRDAIEIANPGDTIEFHVSVTGTITLGGAELVINKDLIINGPGPDFLSIDGDASNRIFTVSSSVTDLTITGLKITNGSQANGGGIYNEGDLALSRIEFIGNHASNSGGAIFNLFDVSISESTFRDNTAGDYGGAIFNNSTSRSIDIQLSTITGNTAGISGGGLYTETSTSTSVINTTIHNNSAISGGGIFNEGDLYLTMSTISDNKADFFGGGIRHNTGNLEIYNSIIANSSSAGDCFRLGGSILGIKYIVEDGSCSAPISGDPKLDVLADNGGETKTIALLTGSIAIDAADDGYCWGTDQRGVSRPQGSHCDIGSYEGSIPIDNDNVGFYVPDQNKWYLKNNQINGWNDFISVKFGCSSPDWMPVAGDWDNDGVDTIGFYVPDQLKWYLKNNLTDGWTDFVAFKFGGPTGSVAVAGDWDNDGIDTVGFYVPSQGKWYLKNNQINGWNDYLAFNFAGPSGSIPVAGDWDNDGIDTVGFYVPSQGKWYLKNNQINGWNDFVAINFAGATGSLAVAGDWDGDGEGTIGFYVPSQMKWYLKNNQTSGWTDFVAFNFGGPFGSQPVAGDWD